MVREGHPSNLTCCVAWQGCVAESAAGPSPWREGPRNGLVADRFVAQSQKCMRMPRRRLSTHVLYVTTLSLDMRILQMNATERPIADKQIRKQSQTFDASKEGVDDSQRKEQAR